MIEDSFQIRVRYSETDQMGFVHHSNYARYYECARWELFRNLGISYSKIEESGLLIPVIEMTAKFLKPLRYDDIITVKTLIKKPPTSKLRFDVQILVRNSELVHQANIVVGFISKQTQKACRPSVEITEALNKYFSNQKL